MLAVTGLQHYGRIGGTAGAGRHRGSDDGGRAARPTMEDVARLAGVSHQTVSRMLNDHPNVRAPTRANVRRDFRAVLAKVDGIDPKRLDAAGTPPLLRLDAF
jgi:Bacterial regulatory proteins, lacI family